MYMYVVFLALSEDCVHLHACRVHVHIYLYITYDSDGSVASVEGHTVGRHTTKKTALYATYIVHKAKECQYLTTANFVSVLQYVVVCT